jgi:hypothetical protein
MTSPDFEGPSCDMRTSLSIWYRMRSSSGRIFSKTARPSTSASTRSPVPEPRGPRALSLKGSLGGSRACSDSPRARRAERRARDWMYDIMRCGLRDKSEMPSRVSKSEVVACLFDPRYQSYIC